MMTADRLSSLSWRTICEPPSTLPRKRAGRTFKYGFYGTGPGNERTIAAHSMTVLEALAILEASVLECKKRDINTQEVKKGAGFVGAVYLAEVVDSQFRHSVENEEQPLEKREGQQQVLRATFP